MLTVDNTIASRNSPSLYRCLSGRNSRPQSFANRSRTQSLNRTKYIQAPSPPLPTELLDQIVIASLENYASFSDIASLSLVSSSLRQITLRRFFRVVQIESRNHWASLCRLMDVSNVFINQAGEYGRVWVRLVSHIYIRIYSFH